MYKQIISKMTLKEKIGQLMMVGFTDIKSIEYLVKEYKVGNIILFTRNIKDINSFKTLNEYLHNLVLEYTNIFPLISIDQEGGMVTRIHHEITFPPGAMSLGATNYENSKKIGSIVGRELRSLGINMNLAPCLDININKQNLGLGVRCFSDDKEKVSKHGINYIQGLQENVIATAKHFPGKGDTFVDSHLDLPILNCSKEDLFNNYLYPFKSVINDVLCVMSSHALYTNIDKSLPASLSKVFLTDILRNKLNFEGIILSDCLEMKAIENYYLDKIPEGILNGLDMLLVCHTLDKQIKIIQDLEKFILNNNIENLIDEKVYRILKIKDKVKNLTTDFMKMDYKENKNFARSVVSDSFTKVKGDLIKIDENTLVIGSSCVVSSIVEDEFKKGSIIDSFKKEFPNIKCIEYDESDDLNKLLDISSNYEKVLVFSYNSKLAVDLINKLPKEKVYVIGLKGPHDLLKFDCLNYSCFYEYTINSIDSCIKHLKYNLPLNGVMPINIK